MYCLESIVNGFLQHKESLKRLLLFYCFTFIKKTLQLSNYLSFRLQQILKYENQRWKEIITSYPIFKVATDFNSVYDVRILKSLKTKISIGFRFQTFKKKWFLAVKFFNFFFLPIVECFAFGFISSHTWRLLHKFFFVRCNLKL